MNVLSVKDLSAKQANQQVKIEKRLPSPCRPIESRKKFRNAHYLLKKTTIEMNLDQKRFIGQKAGLK